MTSFRQFEANRRNALYSTGPATAEGKQRSRQNAVRHGLTAETVIDSLEDAEDYSAFELSITADYDPQSATERELVLRLASLLWRLRRATAIEAGLFKIQARYLLQFRQKRNAHQERQKIIEEMYQNAATPCGRARPEEDVPSIDLPAKEKSTLDVRVGPDDLTHSFVRLCNLPTYPLDRLSRYEAIL